MSTPTKLDAALKDIEDSFGHGSILRLGEAVEQVEDLVSTGSSAFDGALGGGLPRGRVVECFGNEGVGKSTLALSIIAQAQKEAVVCALIDTEHSVDVEYAAALGVDVSQLLFSQPNTAEEALEIAQRLTASGAVGVLALDSLAALLPLAELQGEAGEVTVGLKARLIGQAMRKIIPAAAKNNVLILLINQNREAIGVMFGSPIVQPGGRSVKYAAAQRIEVKRGEKVKRSGQDFHKQEIGIQVVKNKIASPYRKAVAWLEYGVGIVDKK